MLVFNNGKEPVVDSEESPFVQSKVTAPHMFHSWHRVSLMPYGRDMLASMFELPEAMLCPASPCRVRLRQVVNKNKHVAGVNQIHADRRVGARLAVSSVPRENSSCLSFSEGRRGVQDCNCFSH